MASVAMLAWRRPRSRELERRAPGAASDEPTPWTAAFDSLVEAVYGYVYAHIPHQPTAEVLTERVFVAAWHHLRAGRWSSRDLLCRLYAQADATIAGHHSRRSDPLARALAELSADERHVLLLRFGQRLEVAAIAELLGMDDHRVRRLQLRALRAMRLASV